MNKQQLDNLADAYITPKVNKSFWVEIEKLTDGDVFEYPLWIMINSPEDNVPTGLVGDTYIDENDVEQPNTWETWLKPNNYIIEREGQKYVGTNAHTGFPLKMSELVPVFDSLVASIPDEPEGNR